MFDFQRTTGVVAKITNQDGSKSAKLAEALSGAKKIVVCTIQTFPHAMEAVRELSDARGQRAVTRRPPQGMMLPEAHDKARERALISARSALRYRWRLQWVLRRLVGDGNA